MIDAFRRQTQLAAYFVRSHLQAGDSAIDGTAGNGMDTLMMAQCVGSRGRVYAFDIQSEAIANTKVLLEKEQLSNRVLLFCEGHETIGTKSIIQQDPMISAVMFNLGFLPGGDKSIFTHEKTTLQALESAMNVLKCQGIMTICAYCHDEGRKEIDAIEQWARSLRFGADVHKIETINHQNSPILYLIRKK